MQFWYSWNRTFRFPYINCDCPSNAFWKTITKGYRNYKNFSNDLFHTDLINEISSNSILDGDLTGFLDACKKSLDYQAPRKKKYTRANQVPFLTKEINKEIMTRSRLRNKFLRCRSDVNKKAYNEQRNRYVKLVRSAKKAYYSNLSIKDVNDNKIFWKTVKPLFSEKGEYEWKHNASWKQ